MEGRLKQSEQDNLIKPKMKKGAWNGSSKFCRELYLSPVQIARGRPKPVGEGHRVILLNLHKRLVYLKID